VKTLLFAACTVAGVAAVAHADAYECKGTETQAECHDRLKCKANEDVGDCQKRLRAAAASQQNNSGGRDGNADDDRDGRDRAASDGGSRGGGESSGGGGRNDDGGYSRRNDGGGAYASSSGGGDHSYHGTKKFGLGLELGEPDGINGKVFLSPSGAIDFGLGYIYDHYYYGDGLHLYADYLWHFQLASTPSFKLPFYIGAGLRMWQFDYCVQNVCDYGGSAVGIRMPLGVAFDLNNTPIDIFVQLVPTLDFLGGDYYMRYRDRTHFGMDGSVGVRFWFK
jgi:hypothetical protein